jgi:hypothetical protein
MESACNMLTMLRQAAINLRDIWRWRTVPELVALTFAEHRSRNSIPGSVHRVPASPEAVPELVDFRGLRSTMQITKKCAILY